MLEMKTRMEFIKEIAELLKAELKAENLRHALPYESITINAGIERNNLLSNFIDDYCPKD